MTLPLAPRQPGGASGPSPRFRWKLQLAEGHTLGGVMTKASSGSSNGQKIAFSMKFPGLGGMGFRVSWDLPTLLQGHQEISRKFKKYT